MVHTGNLLSISPHIEELREAPTTIRNGETQLTTKSRFTLTQLRSSWCRRHIIVIIPRLMYPMAVPTANRSAPLCYSWYHLSSGNARNYDNESHPLKVSSGFLKNAQCWRLVLRIIIIMKNSDNQMCKPVYHLSVFSWDMPHNGTVFDMSYGVLFHTIFI